MIRYGILIAGCVVLLGAMARAENAPAPAAAPDPFDQLCEKIQKDPGGSSEAELKQLFETAKEKGRPFSASLAAGTFLKNHPNVAAGTLFLAAQNAELAGDYRAAVTRYKNYLSAPANADEAAAAAGHLYMLMVDILHADEEAYQFMKAADEGLRKTELVKKFDTWFIGQARTRRDFVPMARRLLAAYNEKLPLEQEKLYFWEPTDALGTELMRGEAAYYDCADIIAKIAPLIREDKGRGLRLAVP
jgi:hypothetical protein